MIVKGITYRDKEQAGQALINCFSEITTPAPTLIGEYRGFEMEVMFDSTFNLYKLRIKKNEIYTIELGKDTFGNITRIENVFGNFAKVIEENTANLEELKRQFENAKEEVKKEFPYENELKEKMLRLSEVNKELEIKDKDDEVIEDVDEQEEIENETKSKDYER